MLSSFAIMELSRERKVKTTVKGHDFGAPTVFVVYIDQRSPNAVLKYVNGTKATQPTCHYSIRRKDQSTNKTPQL